MRNRIAALILAIITLTHLVLPSALAEEILTAGTPAARMTVPDQNTPANPGAKMDPLADFMEGLIITPVSIAPVTAGAAAGRVNSAERAEVRPLQILSKYLNRRIEK